MSWGNKWPPSKTYDVGFGRPPRKNQFKPGQSGNPNGRKKRTKISFAESFDEIFGEEITVLRGGKRVKMLQMEAMIRRYFQIAANGDSKALSTIISLAGKYGVFDRQRLINQMVVRFVAPDGSYTTSEESQQFNEWKLQKEEFLKWKAIREANAPVKRSA